MNDTKPLIATLRRLNTLQGPDAPAWVRELSPGEKAWEVARLTALLPASLARHHEKMLHEHGGSLAPMKHGHCAACGAVAPLRMREQGRLLDVCDGCGRFVEAITSASQPELEEVLG